MGQQFSLIGLRSAFVLLAMIILSGWQGMAQQVNQPTQGTLASNIVTQPGATSPDVDLTITDLRYSPPNPIPGQRTTISLIIKNFGAADSGPFQWAWFAQPPDQNVPPSITGRVSNLGPGESQVVKSDYYFGLWGSYLTTAWVNFDNQVPDTNRLNDLRQGVVTTTSDPMVVDFTRLPTGDAILNAQPITGREFSAWGFHIAPGPNTNPNCQDTRLMVKVGDVFNKLVVDTSQQTNDCSDLPVTFTLDQAIGGARVQFTASSSGVNTLDLLDTYGHEVEAGTVTATFANQTLTLDVSVTDSVSHVQKVIFTPSHGTATAIQSITFCPPGSSAVPTPDH